MDIHLRVTLTMVAATVAGQITTYLCLLVFPRYWDMYDSKPSENVCDANNIIIMRVDGQKAQTSVSDGGSGPADEGGDCEGTNTETPVRRLPLCSCFGLSGGSKVGGGRCPKCNRQRRHPSNQGCAKPESMEPTQGTDHTTQAKTQICGTDVKRNAVETYQVFTAPSPGNNSSRHWNTVASFVINAAIVIALQCVKRTSMKLNTMWSAVFVSAALALLYSLLASSNWEWRTKQFTNACLVTVHKFIILLSMASVLAYNNVIDPLI